MAFIESEKGNSYNKLVRDRYCIDLFINESIKVRLRKKQQNIPEQVFFGKSRLHIIQTKKEGGINYEERVI